MAVLQDCSCSTCECALVRQFVREGQRTESLMRAARAKWQICLLVSARSSCALTCYTGLHHVRTNMQSISAIVFPGLKTGCRSFVEFVSTCLTWTFQELIYEVSDKTFISFRITVIQIQLLWCLSFFYICTQVTVLTSLIAQTGERGKHSSTLLTLNLQPCLWMRMCMFTFTLSAG